MIILNLTFYCFCSLLVVLATDKMVFIQVEKHSSNSVADPSKIDVLI